MPRVIPFRLAAACALALVLSAAVAITATGAPIVSGGKGVLVDLRVVGKGGKVLTEEQLKTTTTTIKTSPQATCFGAGTGGSGKSVTIKGATALGALGQASKSTSSLRPLLVSDSFDFGLALCGVGGNVAKGKGSWYLKVNHKGAAVSGDAVKLKAGDEVLWDLAPSYPYPKELALEAPERVEAGVPFGVRVVSYDEKGKAKPLAGAKISGGDDVVTGADGRATVTVSATQPTVVALAAAHGKDIPSPSEYTEVCVGGACPVTATP